MPVASRRPPSLFARTHVRSIARGTKNLNFFSTVSFFWTLSSATTTTTTRVVVFVVRYDAPLTLGGGRGRSLKFYFDGERKKERAIILILPSFFLSFFFWSPPLFAFFAFFVPFFVHPSPFTKKNQTNIITHKTHTHHTFLFFNANKQTNKRQSLEIYFFTNNDLKDVVHERW